MFSLVDKSALIINFEGREAKGLSKGRYDETFAGEDEFNKSTAFVVVVFRVCFFS